MSGGRMVGPVRWIAPVAAALFVGPLLVIPIRAVADEWRGPSLWPQRFGLRGVVRLVDDPVVPRAVANSLLVAAITVAAALVIAWPAARSLARTWRPAVAASIMAPLLLPPLVVGEGLRLQLLRLGLADSHAGLVLAHLVYVIPYVTVVLLPAFTVDLHEQEQAAITLGADRRWRFRLVTLPGVGPQLALASALGFTVSWSQYGTSLGVGGGIPMLPLVLVPFIRSDPQLAAVLDLVFLGPPLAVLILAVRSRR